jgi:hypothetical protein
MSAIEYVKSTLKYLNEEDIRKEDFLDRDFHKELDNINYKQLIDNYSKTIGKVSTHLIRLDGFRYKVYAD